MRYFWSAEKAIWVGVLPVRRNAMRWSVVRVINQHHVLILAQNVQARASLVRQDVHQFAGYVHDLPALIEVPRVDQQPHGSRQIHRAVGSKGQRNSGGASWTLWKALGSMVITTCAGVVPEVADSVTPVVPSGRESEKSVLTELRLTMLMICCNDQLVAGVRGKQRILLREAHLRQIRQLSDRKNRHAADGRRVHRLSVAGHLRFAGKIFGQLKPLRNRQVIGGHYVQHRCVTRRRYLGVDQVTREIPGMAAKIEMLRWAGEIAARRYELSVRLMMQQSTSRPKHLCRLIDAHASRARARRADRQLSA